MPLQFNSEVKDGCPFDCGLCPDHQQHTCVGIIEVTGRCNLDCPVCFAGDEHDTRLSLEQVDSILENLLRCEEWPDVVQFSGGEPTVHPQILDMLRLAKSKPIKAVMLNTNGLRIANDKRFVDALAEIRPYIYLQFDGLEAQTYERLRGRNLLDVKLRALDNLAAAGLGAILVSTVIKGVNDHEVGEIVKFGVRHPAVRGVSFQPGFAQRPLSAALRPDGPHHNTGRDQRDRGPDRRHVRGRRHHSHPLLLPHLLRRHLRSRDRRRGRSSSPVG